MPEFRKARLKDAETIAALHARNWQLNYRGILDDHYLDHQVVDDRRAVWQERLTLEDPKLLLILAEEEQELVGFTCLFYDDDPKYGALLDNLHVAVEHSGKGIGQLLIRKLAAEIQQRGKRQDMYLWVLKDNTGAIRLYERLGGERKEQLLEKELGNVPIEKIRYYWPDISTLISS